MSIFKLRIKLYLKQHYIIQYDSIYMFVSNFVIKLNLIYRYRDDGIANYGF